MTAETIEIVAPSRLHFGMLSFGQPAVRQFGGVGAMIDYPELKLTLSADERLSAKGPLAERALQFARLAADHWQLACEPRCRITIDSAPPPHVGLGSGTQLAMAVAAGLLAFQGRPPATPEGLARAVGRGLRSAIGSYGFAQGGLLVESGKPAADRPSPLLARLELPSAWRFVLLCPQSEAGLSGAAEQAAFARLPPVPTEITDRLAGEILLHLLPAAASGDFDEFSDSLFRYGLLSGTCFEKCQGGAFAHPQLVERLRSWGVRGVGQSSWGPTVFALLPDEVSAGGLLQRIRADDSTRSLVTHLARPANAGAKLNGRPIVWTE